MLLYINLGFSLCVCLLIVLRQHCQGILDGSNQNLSEGEFTMKITKYTYAEVLMVLLHPYPFWLGARFEVFNQDIIQRRMEYAFNDLLHITSFIRVFYVSRYILAITRWRSLSSSRICNMLAADFGDFYALKGAFKRAPFLVIPYIFTVGFLSLSFMYKVSESPSFILPFLNGFNAELPSSPMWFISMTVTGGTET